MLISVEEHANVEDVKGALSALGLWTQTYVDGHKAKAPILRVLEHSSQVSPGIILETAGVKDVWSVSSPHPRIDTKRGHVVRVAGHSIGAGHAPVLMAGPCSAEDPEQVEAAAAAVQAAGGSFLRGGAFKPRTSPDSFSGHGAPALTWLRDAADRHGLALVTEVMSEREVDAVCAVADLIQIGSRNMQNFALLKAVGQNAATVLLKRGRAASVEEWLQAGEHLLAAGAKDVIFCERGIQGGGQATRNLLDLSAVALLSSVYKLPVIVDPSHALGRTDLVEPMASAALAAGANGLLIEVHPKPAMALSDGPQAMSLAGLARLSRTLNFTKKDSQNG